MILYYAIDLRDYLKRFPSSETYLRLNLELNLRWLGLDPAKPLVQQPYAPIFRASFADCDDEQAPMENILAMPEPK